MTVTRHTPLAEWLDLDDADVKQFVQVASIIYQIAGDNRKALLILDRLWRGNDSDFRLLLTFREVGLTAEQIVELFERCGNDPSMVRSHFKRPFILLLIRLIKAFRI